MNKAHNLSSNSYVLFLTVLLSFELPKNKHIFSSVYNKYINMNLNRNFHRAFIQYLEFLAEKIHNGGQFYQ